MFLLWHPWLTTTNLSYSFSLLETSATASCGTTGKDSIHFGKARPWKPTWQWKITILNRRNIFKWCVFHCHVSFPGCIFICYKISTFFPRQFTVGNAVLNVSALAGLLWKNTLQQLGQYICWHTSCRVKEQGVLFRGESMKIWKPLLISNPQALLFYFFLKNLAILVLIQKKTHETFLGKSWVRLPLHQKTRGVQEFMLTWHNTQRLGATGLPLKLSAADVQGGVLRNRVVQ